MRTLLRDYFTMLVIRRFEEKVEELFSRGLVRGTSHTAVGQEAVAVGVCSALRRSDYATSTHRGHGHFIAKGGDPRRVMAELFGKQTGYSRGRGGSQFMADLRMGFIGANGITGGSIPIATGAALTAKLRKSGRVVACFFGDGASNQGSFHESLNMASIWRLPIVFVCENNLYAMSTPVQRTMAVADIAQRGAAYGIPSRVVDGNDLPAVKAAAREAVSRARRGEGPTLLECKTYRFSGHSRGDPRVYRSREEEAAHRKLDPLPRLRRALKEQNGLTAEADRHLQREARRTIQEAVRFAMRSPDPDVSTLTEGVFA